MRKPLERQQVERKHVARPVFIELNSLPLTFFSSFELRRRYSHRTRLTRATSMISSPRLFLNFTTAYAGRAKTTANIADESED